jgi:hypothetical protein
MAALLSVMVLLLTTLGTVAQPKIELPPDIRVDPPTGVTIETQLVPNRVLGFLWSSGDDLKIKFYVDGRTQDFAALWYGCQFLDTNRQDVTLTIPYAGIPRTAFELAADGRLFANKTYRYPPVYGGVNCKALGLAR